MPHYLLKWHKNLDGTFSDRVKVIRAVRDDQRHKTPRSTQNKEIERMILQTVARDLQATRNAKRFMLVSQQPNGYFIVDPACHTDLEMETLALNALKNSLEFKDENEAAEYRRFIQQCFAEINPVQRTGLPYDPTELEARLATAWRETYYTALGSLEPSTDEERNGYLHSKEAYKNRMKQERLAKAMQDVKQSDEAKRASPDNPPYPPSCIHQLQAFFSLCKRTKRDSMGFCTENPIRPSESSSRSSTVDFFKRESRGSIVYKK
jgi:hypothetical protein